MSLFVSLLLIPATWLLAWALVPWAARYDGFLPLLLVLLVGCSGSLVGVCIQ